MTRKVSLCCRRSRSLSARTSEGNPDIICGQGQCGYPNLRCHSCYFCRLPKFTALCTILHLHFDRPFMCMRKNDTPRRRDIQQQKPQQVDLTSIGFLFGASALWGTYPSTIKCFFNSPGSPISPGRLRCCAIVMAAVSMVVYGLTSGDAEERAASGACSTMTSVP